MIAAYGCVRGRPR